MTHGLCLYNLANDMGEGALGIFFFAQHPPVMEPFKTDNTHHSMGSSRLFQTAAPRNTGYVHFLFVDGLIRINFCAYFV